MQLLHIRLFGTFQLTLGDTPVAQISSTRLQARLAYLVLQRATPLSRQHLAFTFYTDSNETQARGNLRRLLFDFRRALPAADARCDWQPATVQWRDDASFTLDVRDFENARADAAAQLDSTRKPAALERAVALYRGALLPNCYDDWLAPVREKYRHAFLSALQELIELLENQRLYRRALDFAQMPRRSKTTRRVRAQNARARSEPCRGEKVAFASWRECNMTDRLMQSKTKATSMTGD